MPTFDILLPIRDAAATLGETLDSIAAQTFRDFRCLLLDDGSLDSSREVAQDFASIDARFECVSLPASGISATLNEGIRRVDAPWVVRIDADDVALPGRLAIHAAEIERDRLVDVTATRVEFFGERVSENLRAYEAWMNDLLTHEAIVRDLFVESPLAHPSVAIRAEALRAIGGYRVNEYPEDYDLWLRGYRAGWRFAKSSRVGMRVRDHGARLTKTDPHYTSRAFLECKVEHFVESRNLCGQEVIVWGAGRDGKRAAKSLRRRGVALRHFVDIAPSKIGRRTMQLDVLPFETLGEKPGCLIVAAVGVRGARGEIRRQLSEWGYREMEEFVCFG